MSCAASGLQKIFFHFFGEVFALEIAERYYAAEDKVIPGNSLRRKEKRLERARSRIA